MPRAPSGPSTRPPCGAGVGPGCRHVRAPGRRAAAIAGRPLVLLATLLLSACFQQTGDFGRRADNVWTGSILPRGGETFAWFRGEPVSPYPLTDDELELRDRAWRFVMPAHEKSAFQKKLAEFSYTRVLPQDVSLGDDVYHAGLLTGPFRSPSSRYLRLAEDVEADHALIGPFTETAQRVCEADRWRRDSLPHVRDLQTEERDAALARIVENELVTDWVYRRLTERLKQYRYALEHMVIEMPQKDAIVAERALLPLEQVNAAVQGLVGCRALVGDLPPVARRAGPDGKFRPKSPPPVIKDAERDLPPK